MTKRRGDTGTRRRGGIPASQGFTLMEVLVSLVIVVAAIAIIAQGFSAGAQSATSARNETTAARLAGRKMAELETGEISLTQGSSGSLEGYEEFRYEITSEADSTGIYKVAVSVYYAMGGGEERAVTLYRLMRARPTSQ